MTPYCGKAADGEVVSGDGYLDGFDVFPEGKLLDILDAGSLSPIPPIDQGGAAVKVIEVLLNDGEELRFRVGGGRDDQDLRRPIHEELLHSSHVGLVVTNLAEHGFTGVKVYEGKSDCRRDPSRFTDGT